MKHVLVSLGITHLVRSFSESHSHASDYSTLGDASFILRCMHTLSQFYQGLPSEFAVPTFKKHHFPTPSHSVVNEFWPRMPRLHATCDFNELARAPSRKDFEIVRWRIDNDDIEELRSVLSSKKQDPDGPLLSKQDCLVAYVVAALNHNTGNPMQMVTYVASVG